MAGDSLPQSQGRRSGLQGHLQVEHISSVHGVNCPECALFSVLHPWTGREWERNSASSSAPGWRSRP